MTAPPAAADPSTTRVGWIGTGVMGSAMASRLLEAGYRVTVNTRRPGSAGILLEAGAGWADTPAGVAAESDVVFAMVGHPSDVREVVLGPHGALLGARPGTVLVDMTTSEPALAIEIAKAAAAQGSHALDAPVSGGDLGARNGTLSIMVGGDAEVLAAVRPLFERLGTTIVRQGGAGAGQHTKAVNQILIAGTMMGLAEALVYGHAAGLDLPTVLESVGGGAAGSWSLANLAPRVLAGNFAPGFFVDHMVKDLGIALSEAGSAQVSLPALALARQLYTALQAQGGGRDGTQALVKVLAGLSGFEWPAPE